eukprot:COSAG03_NODE_146_length_11610_cov_7.478586_5_plen_51_part_00
MDSVSQRAAHRAALNGSKSTESEFDNPMAESDDEESGSSGKKDKKGKKKG